MAATFYVWRPKVEVTAPGGKVRVFKDIIRYRVLKHSTKNLTVTPWPESYGSMDARPYPIDECFTNLEDAKRQLEELTSDAIAELTTAIKTLKEEAHIRDRTQSVNADTEEQ
jgi:hypothetical protein